MEQNANNICAYQNTIWWQHSYFQAYHSVLLSSLTGRWKTVCRLFVYSCNKYVKFTLDKTFWSNSTELYRRVVMQKTPWLVYLLENYIVRSSPKDCCVGITCVELLLLHVLVLPWIRFVWPQSALRIRMGKKGVWGVSVFLI